MRRKVLLYMLAGALFLAGTGLLLYPVVSNMLAQRDHLAEIDNYDRLVAGMDEQQKEEELQKARAYNAALTGSGIDDPFSPGSGTVLSDDYTSVLNVHDGIMGYLKIPAIDICPPIYHGTSERVLTKGVGHVEDTAFPIGGEGNHTVLTGHTGLSSVRLFTDIDKLELEDIFYITVLDTTIAYEVDQILVVTPDDISELMPVAEEDHVTLVTCTPYGINSHRLLVRGTRIPYTEEMDNPLAEPVSVRLAVLAAVALLIVLVIIIRSVHKYRKSIRPN